MKEQIPGLGQYYSISYTVYSITVYCAIESVFILYHANGKVITRLIWSVAVPRTRLEKNCSTRYSCVNRNWIKKSWCKSTFRHFGFWFRQKMKMFSKPTFFIFVSANGFVNRTNLGCYLLMKNFFVVNINSYNCLQVRPWQQTNSMMWLW